MPPSAVRTIRDLIFWQYAKIISASASAERHGLSRIELGPKGATRGTGKKNYGFIMNRFKALQSGKIEWSGAIREYVKEREKENQCIYCGAKDNLSYDHLLPRSRGGPDISDNVVQACKHCNSSKSDKGVYEWFKLDKKDKVPRVVVKGEKKPYTVITLYYDRRLRKAMIGKKSKEDPK